MVYNIFNVVKDAITGKLKFAPQHIIDDRRSICNSCEVRNELVDVCTACGCFLPAKIRLTKSTCPLELW